MKKTILFDLDGTLMDSMGVWREIDVEFLGRFGMPVPDDLLENITTSQAGAMLSSKALTKYKGNVCESGY